MSYVRGPSYRWRDDHSVHIWAEDGYDGWAEASWSEGRKHSVGASLMMKDARNLF